MKKIILPAITLSLIVFSCGPAAEDKKIMHERAKIFQDSIASVIRKTLAEAEGPASAPPVVAPAPTAAPTATTPAQK
jgi:hypothetical protein